MLQGSKLRCFAVPMIDYITNIDNSCVNLASVEKENVGICSSTNLSQVGLDRVLGISNSQNLPQVGLNTGTGFLQNEKASTTNNIAQDVDIVDLNVQLDEQSEVFPVRCSCSQTFKNSIRSRDRKLLRQKNRIRSLVLKNNFFKQKLKSRNSLNKKLIGNVVCSKSLAIVENEIINNGKKPNGYRFSAEIKRFALQVFFYSPMAYRFLRTVLILPCIATIRKMLDNMPIGSGLHETYFSALKFKGDQMDEMAKNCLICLDEVSIKDNMYFDRKSGLVIGVQDTGKQRVNLPAKYSLAVMARGISSNWKHSLGFILTHRPCD